VTPERVVIVGASLAGLRAAETLRREGYTGPLTLIGAEPHLPYDRPPLSKQVLRGEWGPERLGLRRGGDYAPLDLDLRLGKRATSLDIRSRTVSIEGGVRVPYDGLIIATGAFPRRLRGVPDLEGVCVLRTLDDALALRAALERRPRVVVIGAGFIGTEVAASCRALGVDVTVVEALDAPCVRGLGPEIGALLGQVHRDHGVDLRCGVGLAGVDGAQRVERVRLQDGSALEADLVVVGVGAAPATEWLATSGLAVDDGVLCDATGAARAPGVFAAGDVARWYHPLFGDTLRVEHWSNAVEQGVAAARALLAGPGKAEPLANVPFVWSDQYDQKIQCVGHPRPSDTLELVSGSFESRKFACAWLRNDRISGAVIFNDPRAMSKLRRAIAERATRDTLATLATA
jgi:NADPH-dependent 2,4-dienoyl-CoA reductase/sulfur reductase-like enzyme